MGGAAFGFPARATSILSRATEGSKAEQASGIAAMSSTVFVTPLNSRVSRRAARF